jgi:hypothetical protein
MANRTWCHRHIAAIVLEFRRGVIGWLLKEVSVSWTSFIRLRIGTSGELVGTRKCIFTSLKRGNFLDNT